MTVTVVPPVGFDPPKAEKVVRHAQVMMNRYRRRDQVWNDVLAMRRGDWDNSFPDMVSDIFDAPIVANVIDTTARDLAEMLAPLPSFSCTSVSMRTDAERKRADLRTRIVNNYANHCEMAKQMLYATDGYFSYSMAPIIVEPDFDSRLPRPIFEDAFGGYPEFDRMDRLTSYLKRWWIEAGLLAEAYPEYEQEILANAKATSGATETRLEMFRYIDAKGTTFVMGGRHSQVLDYIPNRLSRIPVVIARRPWLNKDEFKGQFDDSVAIQMARNILAMMQIEAVYKTVQAPLALPADVQEVNYGGDAIMRSQTPEKIRRVGLEMSNMGFLENNQLMEELRTATRYPAARVGESDASVVTGRGVQALLGGMEQQIKAGQTVFRQALMDVMSLCFEMDETYWPNAEKKFRGEQDGTPYEVIYTPAKDINGQHTCQAEYGFAAGLDPNRAVVLLLQLRAEGCFSRDFMQRNLPFDINVNEENTKRNVEDTREALLQSVFGYVQSIPALAAQGMDPSEAVGRVATIVKGLQKGKSVEDVVSEAFTPPAPEEPPAGGETPGVPNGLPGGGSPPGGGAPGLAASGLMQGVAPGQAGMAPGGKPDMATMLAGLTGAGQPALSASVSRRRRV